MKPAHQTTVERAVVTANGIKELLKSYTWQQAICEFIWNGFDAGATSVNLFFKTNPAPLDLVTTITVADNGTGIEKDTLNRKFRPIYESEKAVANEQPKHHSLPHGKNGKGRLTFFTFARRAKWITTFQEGKRLKTQEIEISASELDSYSSLPLEETSETTGTTVVFSGVSELTRHDLESELIPFLKKEFAWFLELNKPNGYLIEIDGVPLDYEGMIQERESQQWNEGPTNERFEVEFILWREKFNSEYSKYYYANGKKSEVWKENTTLNNKGDSFYHSVYIRSSYFDDFLWSEPLADREQLELLKSRRHDVFKSLSVQLSKLLHEKRNPFIDQYTETLVREYDKEGVFPEHGVSPVGEYQNQLLRTTVKELYKVQPKVFTQLNLPQKKAFIGLLDALIDLGADDRLLEIISRIVEMTPAERSQLAHILDYASFSAITKTIALIKDRFKVVQHLKLIVLDDKWGANEADVQSVVEKHFWLFGEQYNLVTAEEPDFEEALRRYVHLLRGDGETRKPKILHPDKNKEMDIFACRKNIGNDTIQNVVVELKHPLIALGKKELNQVDLYQGVILEQPEFTAGNTSWNFYLVGRSFDTSKSIERAYESASNHGERYLVQKNASTRSRVFVMLWSDVFAEFECRHKFLLEKLELDKVKIISEMKKNSDRKELANYTDSSSAAESVNWQSPREPIGSTKSEVPPDTMPVG